MLPIHAPFKLLILALIILAISLLPLPSLLSRSVARLSQLKSHIYPSPAIISQTPLQAHFNNRTFTTTTAAMSYAKELEVALLAVQRASILTKAVFSSHSKGTLSKSDSSPVTIGDFGAQALIISSILSAFPDDEVVGEEDANDLRANPALKDLVWELVQDAKLSDAEAESKIGGPIKSADEMLSVIDKGNSQGGKVGRIWALDPIDGTKGFLRGGQYAVCLALMVNGVPVVGVIGCPNLPIDDTVPIDATTGADADSSEGKGVLFGAVHEQGATSRPLGPGALLKSNPIKMKEVKDISQATFCESVEAGHSSHGDNAAIASKLGITKPSVRMDSQAKYGSIARGAGDLYLRLPVSATYEEKIWDHAAGYVIVEEAGGKVTDSQGNLLDFSKGRTLKDNKGVVAAPKPIFDTVIKVVRDVLGHKD